jgi:predicted acetyltransferase
MTLGAPLCQFRQRRIVADICASMLQQCRRTDWLAASPGPFEHKMLVRVGYDRRATVDKNT